MRGVLAAWTTMVCATAMAACSSSSPSGSVPDGGAGDDSSTDGSSALSGIFVSPSGNDSNAGTQASPVKTLAHAIDLAKTGTDHRVNACAGTYAEHVVIDAAHDGVSIYGGFSCADWTYATTNVVNVAPTDPGLALAVVSLATGTTIEDVSFAAGDARTPGDSSIAVLVDAAQSVVFHRVTMKAGNGAPGAAGVDGASMSNYDVSLMSSDSKIAGHNGMGQVGGNAQTCAALCMSGTASTGGTGGNGSGIAANVGAGTAGGPLIPENPMGLTPKHDGAAGAAATLSSVCGAGYPGATAADAAAAGGPATALGSLTSNGWTTSDGQAGTSGGPGQGGGGGGGTYDATNPSGGFGGGGGGCGGCGGSGGGGGHGGGSSFALLSVSSAVTLDACVLQAGNGADGGKGGAGQPGQNGGVGGASGAHNGCGGGPGGTGGGGAGGGGGTGGLSIAIGYTGVAPAMTGATMTSAGQPGHGGPGGAGSNANNGGAKGLDGVAQPTKAL